MFSTLFFLLLAAELSHSDVKYAENSLGKEVKYIETTRERLTLKLNVIVRHSKFEERGSCDMLT